MGELNIDYAKVSQWLDVNAARFQARVPPTDDDQKWFHRNRKSKNGWPRLYRVRKSVASDHWIFDLGLVAPDGCITIVRNHEFWRAIVSVDADKFGPPVDTDEYCRLRLCHVPGVDLRNDPQWRVQ
jgi:hypothetical protein